MRRLGIFWDGVKYILNDQESTVMHYYHIRESCIGFFFFFFLLFIGFYQFYGILNCIMIFEPHHWARFLLTYDVHNRRSNPLDISVNQIEATSNNIMMSRRRQYFAFPKFATSTIKQTSLANSWLNSNPLFNIISNF